MIKFKIFTGDVYEPADEILNNWLDKHPEVDIISFRYSVGESYDRHVNSICIMYREI